MIISYVSVPQILRRSVKDIKILKRLKKSQTKIILNQDLEETKATSLIYKNSSKTIFIRPKSYINRTKSEKNMKKKFYSSHVYQPMRIKTNKTKRADRQTNHYEALKDERFGN